MWRRCINRRLTVSLQRRVTFLSLTSGGNPSLLRSGYAVIQKKQVQLEGDSNNMNKQEPAYLLQEYNYQFWQPVYGSQMMDELAVSSHQRAATADIAGLAMSSAKARQ